MIDIDSFQIFTIPPLPPEFLSAKGKGYISVTLAFDPPTRHTRGDSYLGVTMNSDLFRNAKPEDIANAIRAWSKKEQENEGLEKPPSRSGLKSSEKISFSPKKSLLAKGTLQKGIAEISGGRWTYNNEPLFLAVTCLRKWAPATIASQRFAVIVSIEHENPEVNLYVHLQQYAQVTNRARARV